MSEDNTEQTPEENENPDVRYSYMMVNADELEYLQSYWEIRDVGQLFGWAWRLLHDLTKADEMGWVMALQKAEIDEVEKTIKTDPRYRAASFRLKWMVPEADGFFRIPVEHLETKMKRDNSGGETAR